MKRIFLVGFMGCGKTTMGKKLAGRLHIPFADLDRLVEEEAGRSVEDIFRSEGEAGFRKLETNCLKRKVSGSLVMATGGGTAVWKGQIRWMNETGLTVYLKQEASVLAQRLSVSSALRPLVHTVGTDELPETVETLLREREPYYLQAKIVLEGLGKKAGDADKLVKAVEMYYSR